MARSNHPSNKKQVQRQGASVTHGVSALLRNPVQTTFNWFDGYFLHQSKLFYRLVMLIALMLGCGLVMVLSASNVVSIKATGDAFAEFRSQIFYASLGLLFMVFISKRKVATIQNFSMFFFALSILMQLAVLIPGVGVTVGGNTNWISIPGFTIQPSEFLKLGIILALATWISPYLDSLWDWRRSFLPLIGFGFLPAGIVLLSSEDLGTAAVMVVFVLALAFLIGVPWNFLGMFVSMGALAFYVASVMSPNRMRRILAFFDRASIPADETNWQITHGTWALASGGLFGTGLGDSKMKWGWIPAVENDFIFSVVGEEVGLIGAVVVIILFFMLARYIRQVSINSATDFGSVAVTGIMLWITLQAFINIAVVLDLFPVIGVPLPLFSRGGSSMMAVLMALGVVLAVERDRAIPKRGVRKK
jgi:cell division protein FtsW